MHILIQKFDLFACTPCVKGSFSLACAFFFAVWASEVENQTSCLVVLIDISVSYVPLEEEIKWCTLGRQTEVAEWYGCIWWSRSSELSIQELSNCKSLPPSRRKSLLLGPSSKIGMRNFFKRYTSQLCVRQKKTARMLFIWVEQKSHRTWNIPSYFSRWLRVVAPSDCNITSVNTPSQTAYGLVTERNWWCIEFVAWKFERRSQQCV